MLRGGGGGGCPYGTVLIYDVAANVTYDSAKLEWATSPSGATSYVEWGPSSDPQEFSDSPSGDSLSVNYLDPSATYDFLIYASANCYNTGSYSGGFQTPGIPWHQGWLTIYGSVRDSNGAIPPADSVQIQYQCPGGSFSGWVGSGGVWGLNVPSDWSPDDCGQQPFIITAQDLSWGMHWNLSLHLYAPQDVNFTLPTAVTAWVPIVYDYVGTSYARIVAQQGSSYTVQYTDEIGGNGVTSTASYTFGNNESTSYGEGLEVLMQHWITGQVNFSAYSRTSDIEGIQIGGYTEHSNITYPTSAGPYSPTNLPPDSAKCYCNVSPGITISNTSAVFGSVSGIAGLQFSVSVGVSYGIDASVSFTVDLEMTVTKAESATTTVVIDNTDTVTHQFLICLQGDDRFGEGVSYYVWMLS